MLALIAIAGALLLFAVAMLRNALAWALALAGAAAVWIATRDLPATCTAALASLFVASVALQVGAASTSLTVRVVTIGAEVATAAAAAATLAFMLFQKGQSMQALLVTMASAALLGAGAGLSNRAKPH